MVNLSVITQSFRQQRDIDEKLNLLMNLEGKKYGLLFVKMKT